jgi:ABC-type transporter Mla subunit MlaD
MNQRVALSFLLVITGILALLLDAKTARAADPPATVADVNGALTTQLKPIIQALSDLSTKVAALPTATPVTADNVNTALAKQLAPITQALNDLKTKVDGLNLKGDIDKLNTAVTNLQNTLAQQKTFLDSLDKVLADYNTAMDKKVAAKASAAAAAAAPAGSAAPSH